MAIKKCQPKALTPYLDGELTPETREQVEEHLRSCPACAALLEEVTSARERVHGMGRSLIPATTLMAALEFFRERAGIGDASHLDLDEVETPERAEDAAFDDPRFQAALAGAPLDGVGLMDPPAMEAGIEAAAGAPAVEERAAEDSQTVTWVAVETPVDAAADDTLVSHRPYVPEPPPLEPAPWMTSAPVVEHPDPAVAEVTGALPWEDEAPEEILTAALEDRPDAPEPQPVPPWVEAEAADAEDIEARGRRLVEEDLAGQVAMERETAGFWQTVPPGPEPLVESHREPMDEVAAAVAGMREELIGPPAPAISEPRTDATFPAVASGHRAARYRDARTALPAIDRQVKIGLGAAVAIVILAVAGVLLLPGLLSHRAGTTAAKPAVSPAVTARPAAAASPRSGAAGSPTPSTAPGVPQLTGVVTAGAGGSSYRVLRIRTGNPAAGVYRIVFDLEGSGASPDAQLGRAADGSLYLDSTEINIDQATITAFKPIGPISALSTTGAPGGLSLKLASSLAQSPHYSLYYLTGPNRLVIDLK